MGSPDVLSAMPSAKPAGLRVPSSGECAASLDASTESGAALIASPTSHALQSLRLPGLICCYKKQHTILQAALFWALHSELNIF